MHTTATARIVRMLSAERALTQQDEIALHELQIREMDIASGQDIVREGDRPNHCAILVDGFMFASKVTDDGQRQIVAIFVPGDIPDLHSLHLKVMDITITALGPCRIGSVSHEAVKRLVLAHPSVGFSLWRTTLIDAAISREWVTNLGQRHALKRAAHLFCEILVRRQAVGLSVDNTIPMPMTQNDLADALGLSAVHVNRVVQSLRETAFLRLDRAKLHILDFDGLAALGGFDPAYLHLDGRVY